MWTFLATLMRWPDVTLVASMVSGFDIVGQLAISAVFRAAKDQPKLVTVEDLLAGAQAYVDDLEQSMKASSNPEHDRQVKDLSVKDITRGSAEGFFTRSQLDARFGRGRWRPFPRYAILQAHNDKWRAIDDGCR